MSRKKKVYFLGIGGIGMSALARFYNAKGFQVFGYDLTPTPLTDRLLIENMQLHFNDEIDAIPKEIVKNKEALIIYTPAIPKEHLIFNYLKDQGYTLIKRAEALGALTKEYKTIAVAGTHGKTTTTAIAAHILKKSDIATVSFVGGVMADYNTNILIDEDPELLVVEADEFDRSFLQLAPDYLGITSVDADHLDIYSDKKDLENSFQKLADLVPSANNILKCDSITTELMPGSKSYGFSENSNIRIVSNGYQEGFHQVDVYGLVEKMISLRIPMPGNHNALNTVLAASLCYKAGCSINEIIASIASFKGVKRRFEYVINEAKCIIIDDYAHHPTEINALIDAVHQLYPTKKITGVFQPHLYSRTRDFANDFASSLSRLDKLYLLEIYPAREKEIPGVNAKLLLDLLTLNEKSIVNKENLPVLISSTIPEILLIIGAGDIAHLVPAIKQAVVKEIGGL